MQLVTIYPKEITPTEAKSILAKNSYEGQRNVKRHVMLRYVRDMSEDKWMPGTTLILASVNGCNKVLVDGQHRLKALLEVNKSIEFTIKEYNCKNEKELARLYYMTDRGSIRNTSDMWTATGKRDEFGWTITQANGVGAAIKYILKGFSQYGASASLAVNDDTVLELADVYQDSADSFFDITSGRPQNISGPLFRAAVLSVGLELYRYAPDKSKVDEFWQGVTFDDRLSATDPRKFANKHLLNTSMSHSDFRRKISANFQSRFIAGCWNRWINGDEMKKAFPIKDENASFLLLHTPWNGK